jgi:Family of unknown function (DUF6492)
MMQFALFCKSYRNDVLRAKRLLASIQAFNVDSLPFYLSTPEADRSLFEAVLGTKGYHWVSDESICLANPRATLRDLERTPGYLSQQVIKSEFWRLGFCDNYLCLDSDAQFIRPFGLADFIHPEGDPYTVLHDGLAFIAEARAHGKLDVVDHFYRESAALKQEFGRTGPDHDFAPPPMLWSAKVWRWLDESHLYQKNETLWDAIHRHPMEIRWYGEALLRSQVIPIHAIQPLFKFYHHYWQFLNDKKKGIGINELKSSYLGLVYQSNWEDELTPAFAQRSWASLAWRRIKRFVRGA